MATINIQTQCSMCKEETNTYLCHGCSNNFCFDHLTEHRQSLNEQFHPIQDQFNQFKQIIIDIKNNPEKHPLIEQINQWENDSIIKIKEKAKEYREKLIYYTNQSIEQIQIKLNNSNEQLITNENDFNKFKQRLNELNQELNQTKKISIKQQTNSLINEISIQFNISQFENQIVSLEQHFNINTNQTWKQDANTIAGGHGRGKQLNQFLHPWGIFIDDDQTIYVADSGNDRIVEWKKNQINGQIVAGGNRQGNRSDQLGGPKKVIIDQEKDFLIICDQGNRRVVRWPRRNGQTGKILISNIDCWDLTMDNEGYLYVSDKEKHEVRRWKMGETNGTIVAGGNGGGNCLDELYGPHNIFVDEDHSVYVSDRGNHRVMKWLKGAKEGIVVAGGQGQGNGLKQLSNPHGIIVDQLGSVYVADYDNHRVMRWLKGAEEGTIVVGGNGAGQQPNQLNSPVDLSFDHQNNLYVLNIGNDRVQRFDIN